MFLVQRELENIHGMGIVCVEQVQTGGSWGIYRKSRHTVLAGAKAATACNSGSDVIVESHSLQSLVKGKKTSQAAVPSGLFWTKLGANHSPRDIRAEHTNQRMQKQHRSAAEWTARILTASGHITPRLSVASRILRMTRGSRRR